jgi:hypothetical protein
MSESPAQTPPRHRIRHSVPHLRISLRGAQLRTSETPDPYLRSAVQTAIATLGAIEAQQHTLLSGGPGRAGHYDPSTDETTGNYPQTTPPIIL